MIPLYYFLRAFEKSHVYQINLQSTYNLKDGINHVIGETKPQDGQNMINKFNKELDICGVVRDDNVLDKRGKLKVLVCFRKDFKKLCNSNDPLSFKQPYFTFYFLKNILLN